MKLLKKTEYDKLVTKVNDINFDTGKFILKSDYDADKTELENKIPNISNLATKAALTTKEKKIPNISNLATKAALNIIENKIPDVTNRVKKSDYDTKIKDIENKYITTAECNRLTTDTFKE